MHGWIGAIRHSPAGWELHPLAVDPAHQRQGWGRYLVGALEEMARSEGAITLWLGTDDDFGGTNLFGQDLYPDVVGKLQGLRATAGHPFTFYQRLGYVVTGVLPDVDGSGKTRHSDGEANAGVLATRLTTDSRTGPHVQQVAAVSA